MIMKSYMVVVLTYGLLHLPISQSFILIKSPSTSINKSVTKLNNVFVLHSTNKEESSKEMMEPTTRESPLAVSSQIEQTLEPCVEIMKTLISRYNHLWENKGGIQSLAQGIVYWKPPESVYQTIQFELDNPNNDFHLYNPVNGLPSTIKRLKEKVVEENGLSDVDIMITAGANQAFVNCVLTLMSSEEDRCVVFKPFYFNHVMALQMSRGEDSVLVGVSTVDGVPDISWLGSQLEEERQNHIKMVTIVNPGNPTGVSMTRTQLQAFVELTKRFNIWLIVDNTYEHFDHNHANSSDDDDIPFWCSNEAHVINIFTFSKGYSLAGFRVGYLTVSSNASHMFSQMQKVQDTIPICVSRMSQCAAVGALKAGPTWVKAQVATLGVGRDAILMALDSLDVVIGGSGAMYVMGKLPFHVQDDKEVARILVKEYGIAVIPGSFCGVPGFIRVCYSNLPPDECMDAAKRLKVGIESIVNNGIHK